MAAFYFSNYFTFNIETFISLQNIFDFRDKT